MKPDQTVGYQDASRFMSGLFDGDLHAKRVLSLANAVLGVVKTASLAVSTIGQGLALARGLVTKHAIKQVDRLLSNEGIDIDAALRHWVPYMVGPRSIINDKASHQATRKVGKRFSDQLPDKASIARKVHLYNTGLFQQARPLGRAKEQGL